MFRKCALLCNEVTSQSLLGRRGIVKASSLWLPLVAVISGNVSDDGAPLVQSLLIFLSVALWSQASILANDLTDHEHDRAAGKNRWILRLPRIAGVASVALLAALGALILALMKAGGGAVAAYIGAWALGLLYSVRPVRFKERGLMGPAAYGMAGALAFAVVPSVCLGARWQTLAVLASAVFLDKWVNLHFHQVVDHDADMRDGIRTYAVNVGRDRACQSLKWVAGLTALWLLATLAFVVLSQREWRLPIAAVGLGSALVLAVHVRVRRTRRRNASDLLRELPWPYLVLTYVLFRVVPLVLMARMSLLQPTMWVLFALAAFVIVLESLYAARYRYV